MPLHLKLRPGERLLINGAVLEIGQRHGELVIHNLAHCLRGNELLQEDEVRTPTQRVQFQVQSMIVDPGDLPACLERFEMLIGQLESAFTQPDILRRLAEIRGEVARGNYYRGLSLLKAVRKYEDVLFAAARVHEVTREERATFGRRLPAA